MFINELHLASIQSTDSSGIQNTQIELGNSKHTIHEILTKTHEKLPGTTHHLDQFQWKPHFLRLDTTISSADDTMVFCSNHGHSLDLQDSKRDNCATNNHAVACIACVIYNWKTVKCDTMDEEINVSLAKGTSVSTCYRWIAFIDTLNLGKKSTHVTCCAFLRYIINR